MGVSHLMFALVTHSSCLTLTLLVVQTIFSLLLSKPASYLLKAQKEGSAVPFNVKQKAKLVFNTRLDHIFFYIILFGLHQKNGYMWIELNKVSSSQLDLQYILYCDHIFLPLDP